MKLQTVLEGIGITVKHAAQLWHENPDIQDICYSSADARKACLFFALKGFVTDGKRFISDALRRGATAIVVDNLEGIEISLHRYCLIVDDPRYELAIASCNLFRHPSRSLCLVGVTGTNGKTSCIHIIASILTASGFDTALMGTVQRSYQNICHESAHTTSESYQIQRFLREAVDAGVTAAVIEVSSHALCLHRVVGCEFNAVLLTNLGNDHQDFHGSMEAYYQAKRRLFTEFNAPSSTKAITGITNGDDRYGARLLQEAKIPVVTFGTTDHADFSSAQLQNTSAGISGSINTKSVNSISVTSDLVSTLNQLNITASAAVGAVLNIPYAQISAGIANVVAAPGRMAKIDTSLPFQVFVDFAHNGHALLQMLMAFKQICFGRLIVVFGAGGNKDPMRRKTLAEAAAQVANVSVVTSDNPRFEAPAAIIADISKAWRNCAKQLANDHCLFIEQDRKAAIRMALEMAQYHDIVCIAGKGHERGQIIGKQVISFNDQIVTKSILREIETKVSRTFQTQA